MIILMLVTAMLRPWGGTLMMKGLPPERAHAVQKIRDACRNVAKTAGHVGFPARTFEGQSSSKEWRGQRMEIRESTQYSAQGALTFALWVV